MKTCPTCRKKFEETLDFCPHDGEVLEIDLTSMVGKNLDGQYYIEALLGQGGMGAVYRARHILLGDCVAIKIMSTHLRSNPEYLRRFRREAQAARRFHHPNAVTVYDLRNTSDGMIYMVLEYVEGRTLREELAKRKRFSAAEAFEVLEPIANALNAAHALGVVHRDLKPDNIMIGKSADGQPVVKLLDLGIAKIHQTPDMPGAGATVLTVTGQILGTPHYMSPEQWGVVPEDGNPEIDGRADIYSLGVVFYELIAGRRPFEGKTTQDLAREHMVAEPPALHEILPDVPEAFSHAIARAMTKERAYRQATCEKLVSELRAALQMETANKASFETKATTIRFSSKTASADTKATRKIESQSGCTMEIKKRPFEFDTLIVNTSGQITHRYRGQAQSFSEDLGDGITIDLVSIPGGTFLMGSPETEANRDKAEGPQHQVIVLPFFMGKFEVTQAQWRAVAALPQINHPLSLNPSRFKGDNLPVECVSWEDCQEFCARLSRKTGRTYTLPSEAQWEYACRAKSTKPFHFGDTITSELVNYDGNYPYSSIPTGIYRGQTTVVGSLGMANAFGLYDMHGNVWEWCADTWHENYEGAPVDGSVWETGGDSTLRLMRGGSWYSRGNGCRSALRYADRPDNRDDNIGFRVVVSS